jgi:hypothetical protein
MKDYYGFVYIWMDIKKKMFYIGSHVGTLDDGYTGSSVWFRRAYNKRPLDFKRKILWYCRDNVKKILLSEEERWLKMIKPEELGVRYYNLKCVAAGGNIIGTFSDSKMKKYRKKLRDSAHRGSEHQHARKVVCFGKLYNTLNDAISEIGFNPQRRLRTRKYRDFYYFNEGPVTEREMEIHEKRILEIKKRGIEIRRSAIMNMSKDKRKEKARKAVITRTKNGLDFYKKVSESLKNRPGRKVSVDGIIYDKGRIAAEKLGVNYGTVKVRLRNKNFKNWFYLDDKNKNTNGAGIDAI